MNKNEIKSLIKVLVPILVILLIGAIGLFFYVNRGNGGVINTPTTNPVSQDQYEQYELSNLSFEEKFKNSDNETFLRMKGENGGTYDLYGIDFVEGDCRFSFTDNKINIKYHTDERDHIVIDSCTLGEPLNREVIETYSSSTKLDTVARMIDEKYRNDFAFFVDTEKGAGIETEHFDSLDISEIEESLYMYTNLATKNVYIGIYKGGVLVNSNLIASFNELSSPDGKLSVVEEINGYVVKISSPSETITNDILQILSKNL